MKRLILLLLVCNTIFAYSQQVIEAERLINKGIACHDRGDFERAISLYDSALLIDKDNVDAMAEKAMSLLAMKRPGEAITMCEQTIEKHKGKPQLKNVYVTLGNAHDAGRNPAKALEVYDAGIGAFPEYYQLYFNKGITLVGQERIDESIAAFETSATLNPQHASSHNAIARLRNAQGQRIISLMAFGRFLVLEQQSGRAKENFNSFHTILKGNATKGDKNNITINIDPSMLGDSGKKGKKGKKEKKENDFSTIDLLLAMSAGLDYDEKYENEKPGEFVARKFDTICATLAETKKDNTGFYWNYYAPYFIEMHEKDLLATFSNLVVVASGDASAAEWLKSHQKEVDDFQNWSRNYNWTFVK